MYQSEFRKLKDIELFIPEEKVLIENFISFDEEYFHKINLNDKKIYWPDAWDLKIKYLRSVNNLFELIYNLYNVFLTNEYIFIKKDFLELHQFIDFFFDWDVINDFYGASYEKHFSSFHEYLKYMYDHEPEKFLQFMKKINKINKRRLLKNIENFKKINYKIKKI